MRRVVLSVCVFLLLNNALAHYRNETLDPATRQLADFKLEHPKPIGVATTSFGKPLEVRDAVALNTNIFRNPYFYDNQMHMARERVPERLTHPKGTGAYGYFEVTHDVSRYTSADVFNGIGKKTPLILRVSVQRQNLGGNDLMREVNGFVVKFYTKDGNLDMLGLSVPVFLYRDPVNFSHEVRAFRRNPKSNIRDPTARSDFIINQPDALLFEFWLMSDFGITHGFRRMDGFPIHTYELSNKHGESTFVRFNFRSEQGVQLLSNEAARRLRSMDQDYSMRDLFNAIAEGHYPAWRLEMDVLTEDVNDLDFNPFDVTRLWKNGTYTTVNVGRMVLNRNPDNHFKDIEPSAFNPGNLVPGIPGPHDLMFQARMFAYPDAANYRVGKNHNNEDVNLPNYRKVYNRNGPIPVLDNMKDAPHYFPNSYNGPMPYVDTARPKRGLLIYDRQSVDLQPAADFYNEFVNTEGHKNRMAANFAEHLIQVLPEVRERVIKMLGLVSRDLMRRVLRAIPEARAAQERLRPELKVAERKPRITFVDVVDEHHQRHYHDEDHY